MKTSALIFIVAAGAVFADTPAPTVYLDKSPAVVRYQLKRLTNAQLLALPRDDKDPKFRLVHEAILVRSGVSREARLPSLAALVTLNGSDAVAELLAGLAAVDPADTVTQRELTSILLAQPAEELTKRADKFRQVAGDTTSEAVRRGAYAALVIATGHIEKAWRLAEKGPGGARPLIEAVGLIGDAKLRSAFHPFVEPAAKWSVDAPTRQAAVEALGYIPGHEASSFAVLASVVEGSDGPLRDAAVRSIRRLPIERWPKEQLLDLAQRIVGQVAAATPEERATPAAVEAMQLGYDLAAALPPSEGAPIRKRLRELGVRLVLIRTIREQMLYDVRYFTVEAGKPVQIALENDDVMPHNLVVCEPGSLQEVGLAAATMAPPTDPKVKAYVPASAKVLHATHMIDAGQSTTLGFNAPDRPGEYVFVCTFPGHFFRMYGVMLVVPDIEKWEAAPQPPKDPLTGQVFTSPRTDPAAAGPVHEH